MPPAPGVQTPFEEKVDDQVCVNHGRGDIQMRRVCVHLPSHLAAMRAGAPLLRIGCFDGPPPAKGHHVIMMEGRMS